MKIIDVQKLPFTNAHIGQEILDIMMAEADGTIQIPLGHGWIAGMQIAENPLEDADIEGDEWAFYDFLLNEEDKTIIFDEETTGVYSLEQILMLIESRLNAIESRMD